MANKITQLKSGEIIPTGEPKRYPNSDGYIRLRWRLSPGNYVECYEHRVTSEGKITTAAHVHHKNENKADNGRHNLEPTTTKDHASKHSHCINPYLIALLYNEVGMSFPEIAQRLGVDQGACSRVLSRYHLKQRLYVNDKFMVPIQSLIRLHSENYSAARIAKELDVTPATVRSHIKSLGLAPRKPGRCGNRTKELVTQDPEGALRDGWLDRWTETG